MITCPKCGAQNDPSNRFCDQCGFRFEEAAPVAAAVAPSDETVVAAPAADTLHCPSCGAAVLPGEAFCDVCGASLQNVATPAAAAAAAVPVNDAPTELSPPISGIPAADAAMPSANDAPTTAVPVVPAASGAGIAPAPVDAATPPAPPTNDPQPPAPADTSAAPDAAVDSSTTPAPADATPAAIPVPAVETAPSAPTSAGDDNGERQRLEELMATQDKLIAQMEQMQTMFGAATPPAILDGLQQARDTKAQAEADLQALAPPQPQADPAEVARLEELMATQDKLIAQMEQMQTMFGAATPPAILDGLQQARDTKAQAEADLHGLTGGTAPAAPAAAPAAAAQPAPNATPDAQPAPTAAPAASVPPVQAPAAAVPRLVFTDGNKEVPLPLDKAEIIVGREDPISQIYPEIDLTPFGGETGGVSRQHARITQSNGQWMLTDLNSTNYTRVDGVKIDPQVPVALHDGARLQFGRITTVFHIQ